MATKTYTAMDADLALRQRDAAEMDFELKNDAINNFCIKVRADFDKLIRMERVARIKRAIKKAQAVKQNQQIHEGAAGL